MSHLVEQVQQSLPQTAVPHVEADDGQVGAVVMQVEEAFLVVCVVHDLPLRNHLQREALGPKGSFQFFQGGQVIVILLTGKERGKTEVSMFSAVPKIVIKEYLAMWKNAQDTVFRVKKLAGYKIL